MIHAGFQRTFRRPFQPIAPRIGQRVLDPRPGSRPGTGPGLDVPIVRLPLVVSCHSQCTLYGGPNATTPVALIAARAPLTRVGQPVLDDDGATLWVEVSGEIMENFVVRRVRGYVRLSDLREVPQLPPPATDQPPPRQDPAPAPTGSAGSPSFFQTAGEILLLTSPAWGAFLLSRFLR